MSKTVRTKRLTPFDHEVTALVNHVIISHMAGRAGTAWRRATEFTDEERVANCIEIVNGTFYSKEVKAAAIERLKVPVS
jgi:hypothetical protein